MANRELPSDQPVVAKGSQAALYEEAVESFGAAIERLARSYESDNHKRQDLLQNIHVNIWQSLERFNGQCSLRTWIYRVAHNVAATHVLDERRYRSLTFVGLDDIDEVEAGVAPNADRHVLLSRLMGLVQTLQPLDRELVVLYLEGLDAREIGEVIGISPGNVATKISRIKRLLSQSVSQGGRDVV